MVLLLLILLYYWYYYSPQNKLVGLDNIYLRINWYYHPPHLFDRIYQSVSLLCRTGFFTLSLSLSVSFRSCSYSSFRHLLTLLLVSIIIGIIIPTALVYCVFYRIDPSLYRVVRYLFSSLYMSFVFFLVLLLLLWL